jgi:ribonuclease inhibitor
MKVEIDGAKIASEADFHREIASALEFPTHYGRNLDALWDVMTADVERPVLLVWRNARFSASAMSEKYEQIVGLLNDIMRQDVQFGWSDRFEFREE